jgi:molybdopterin/thiamine biosynthesis adenylyltransferase
LNDSPDKRLEVDFEDENDRYHRQNLISWWDQDRLADASVLVVGAGALGNELVKNLALIGIGHIVVIDMDTIENSNLARCVFFRTEDEGRFKAEVLAERAASLNPDVEVLPIVGDVRLALGVGYFDDFDLVIGGLDNREARMYVNQACWKTSTPWVDGAIEGLMGIVRVFVPPETACYECTMSERDHELVAARRSCTLLSRDEMLGGKVPTTATTASVIAAIEVQEAVKLLHAERLGDSVLAGAGYHFVGLTHDSYVVRYAKREDCLSHDTYEIEGTEFVPAGATFAEVLGRARDDLGTAAIIELEQELALAGSCESCGVHERIERPVDTLDAGHGLCPECGLAWRLEFAHSIDDDSPLLDLTPQDIGLPDNDYLVGRVGTQRRFYRLGMPGSALESLRGALT